MNNYEKIKNMTIDEMANQLLELQLNVIFEIQKKLVYCLPLPNEAEIEKMRKATKQQLESEIE